MLKKISFVAVGNMFNALLGFIYLWAVANSLPVEDFGKYSLFISLTVVIGRLTDFGTNSTFVAGSILNPSKKKAFVPAKIPLFIGAIILGVTALHVLELATMALILIFLGSVLAYALNYTLYAFYQKEEKYTYLVLLYTLPALIKALAAPLFYFGIVNPTVPLTTAIFGLSIFGGALLVLKDNPLKKLNLKIDKSTWKLLLEAWPAGVSQTITEIWSPLSNAIAKIIQGFSDVGVFALANKVSVVFALLSLSIFSVLLPKNAKRKKQELKYSFDEAALLAMLLLVMGVLGVIGSKFVIANFFGPQFEASLDLLNILVFAGALAAVASFMENYFFIEESTGKILAINGLKLGTFILSVLLLVPGMQLRGLALAQLLASIVAVLGTAVFIFAKNESPLKTLPKIQG
ncbi:oligosaccharide flippase family protein [candidate division WWE3 bacterium]|nr:oligosaccharide flippase family protein [candidate division WWE3 bacterium]